MIAIIGVAIFAVGSVAWGVGSQIVNNYYGLTSVDQTSQGDLSGGDVNLGTVSTSSNELASGLNSLRLFPGDGGYPAITRNDMGSLTASGVESAWEVCNFAKATTLCAIQNTTGNKVIITDRYLAFTGSQPVGTLNLYAGTSTSATVLTTEQMSAGGVNGTESLFNQIQLPVGTVATSTFRNGLDNKGAGSKYGVVVNPGEFVVVYATSSSVEGVGSVTSTARLFDGKMYFKWNKLD